MNDGFDIKRARVETRACNDIIHFNNAGASLMPITVSNALHEYLNKEEQIGGYETASLYEESLNKIYSSASELLNCSANEIAFVENAVLSHIVS